MSSFSDDRKWLEAKQVIGPDSSWVEIVSYYRFIGGKNVFVYVVGDGDKKLIVDFININGDDNVLLLNKHEELIIETLDNVTNSRKVFEYSTDYETKKFYLHEIEIKIPVKK